MNERNYAAPKPTFGQIAAQRERMNRVSADFLRVDLETALTFTAAALGAESAPRRARNQKAARKAYDTVVRLIKKVQLTNSEADTLNRGLSRLKAELVKLGEVV